MTNAIVLGSTGEVGKHALLAALASPAFDQVHSFGRSAPKHVDPSTPGHAKLVHTPLDYDKLHGGDAAEAGKLAAVEAAAVLIALGTTKANAGSAEAFTKIDREYVLAAAKAARVEGKEQAVVYCSVSGGARPRTGGAHTSGPSGEGKLTLALAACHSRPGPLRRRPSCTPPPRV